MARGASAHEAKISRHTVYDCFRDERKRVDPPLVMEIVTALGADAAQRLRWESLLEAFQRRTSAASIVTVSDQVPNPDGVFVGRQNHIERLTASAGTYWVSGMPGAGKSQLACAAARTLLAQRKREKVLLADLRGYSTEGPPATPEAVINGLLRLTGLAPHQRPSTRAARATKLTLMLRESGVLLILDDARDAAQVDSILPNREGLSVIITSRVSPEGALAETVEQLALGPFSSHESFELLRQTIGADRTSLESEAAAALAEAAAHLPLAVGLTASRVAARPDWTLGDHLELVTARQQNLRLNDQVAESFALTYRELPAQVQTMFRLLAAYPVTTLDHTSALTLGADAVEDPAAALRTLVQHHLLTSPGPQRYSMHSLVRMHAADLSLEVDRPAVRQASEQRLRRDLVARAWSAYSSRARSVGHVPREPQGEVPLREMTLDEAEEFFLNCTDLLLHVAHTATAGDPAPLHHISETMNSWLLHAGRADDAERLHRTALKHATNSTSAHRARLDLAVVLAWGGRYLESQPHLAAVVADPLRQRADEARLRNTYGIVMERRGDAEAAEQHYLTSLEHARSMGNQGLVAFALSNLAGLYERIGDSARAIETLEESVALSMRLGDRVSSARGKVNLAAIQIDMGASAAAEQNSREALDTFLRLRNGPGVAVAQGNLARSLIDHGRFAEALEWALQGIATTRDEGLKQHELTTMMHASTCYRALGDIAEATRYAEESVELADEVNDPDERALARHYLARCRYAAGDTDSAQRLWKESLALWEQQDDKYPAEVRQCLADVAAAAAQPLPH